MLQPILKRWSKPVFLPQLIVTLRFVAIISSLIFLGFAISVFLSGNIWGGIFTILVIPIVFCTILAISEGLSLIYSLKYDINNAAAEVYRLRRINEAFGKGEDIPEYGESHALERYISKTTQRSTSGVSKPRSNDNAKINDEYEEPVKPSQSKKQEFAEPPQFAEDFQEEEAPNTAKSKHKNTKSQSDDFFDDDDFIPPAPPTIRR